MTTIKHDTASSAPVGGDVRLTILARLKICFEVLTIRSGHAHTAQIKQLSTFMRGYDAGLKDGRLEFGKPYLDLLLAVERKFPNETRFETALRYIREVENKSKNSIQTAFAKIGNIK